MRPKKGPYLFWVGNLGKLKIRQIEPQKNGSRRQKHFFNYDPHPTKPLFEAGRGPPATLI